MSAAGIAVVAVSYDPEKTLATFAKARGITYLLLSDTGSGTIDAYGIRNEAARETRMDGIPDPGIVIVDARGIVRAKLFHGGYKTRPSPREIIEAAREIE
jgi:peroxiredoxin